MPPVIGFDSQPRTRIVFGLNTVDRLGELAGDGRVLEFAIGTGRVAVPLAERGVAVTGIELSRPMLERLRTKVDEAAIPVVVVSAWQSAEDQRTALRAGDDAFIGKPFDPQELIAQTKQLLPT